MCQTPCHEIVSNFSTYIPNSVLELLPNFIQNKKFDDYATLIAIILIIISFLPLKKWFNKKAKSLKQQDDIKLIINNLLQNLSIYEKFYNYYTMDYIPNKQYTINIIPYMDDISLSLELNDRMQNIVDFTIYDKETLLKIESFYVKSKTHFNKLDSFKKYINNPDDSNYKTLNIPHNKTFADMQNGFNTVDRVKDFTNYMYDYMVKTKELAEQAKDLINILRSKYIDSLNPKHPINSHAESDITI